MTLLHFLRVAVLLVPFAAAAQNMPAVEAENYDRCMKLARQTPEAGFETALQWRSQGGRHPAEHCAAVALIGLGQYAEAGKRLEKLADDMRRAPPELLAEVLGQAGEAWLLAGDAPRAHAALTEALARAPDDADLHLGRAEASAAQGDYAAAEADLTAALKSEPKRVDALTLRASARRSLGRLDAALADVQQALKLKPDFPDALLERGNILRLKGDAAGARKDWVRVGMLAPETPADEAAKANIERLELKQEPGAAPPPAPPPAKKRR